jgi:hypothetical protein
MANIAIFYTPTFVFNSYEERLADLDLYLPVFRVTATGSPYFLNRLDVYSPTFEVIGTGSLVTPVTETIGADASFDTPIFEVLGTTSISCILDIETPRATFTGRTGVSITFNTPMFTFNTELSINNTGRLSAIMSMFDISASGIPGVLGIASFYGIVPTLSIATSTVADGKLDVDMPVLNLIAAGYSSRFSTYEMRYVR